MSIHTKEPRGHAVDEIPHADVIREASRIASVPIEGQALTFAPPFRMPRIRMPRVRGRGGESRGGKGKSGESHRGNGRASRAQRGEAAYKKLHTEGYKSSLLGEGVSGALLAGIGIGIWNVGASALYAGYATALAGLFVSQAVPLLLAGGLLLVPGLVGAAYWVFKKTMKTIFARLPGIFFPRTIKYVIDCVNSAWVGMDKWAYSLSETPEGFSMFGSLGNFFQGLFQAVPQAYMLWRNMNGAVSSALDGDGHGIMLNLRSIRKPKEYYKQIIDEEDARIDKRSGFKRFGDWFMGREDGPDEVVA
ncbi:MAG: hypothetical protein AAB573_02120 [Patescibacteria group bacterium]